MLRMATEAERAAFAERSAFDLISDTLIMATCQGVPKEFLWLRCLDYCGDIPQYETVRLQPLGELEEMFGE